MEYLIEFAMFLARLATVVIAILVLIAAVGATSRKGSRDTRRGCLRVRRLNSHFDELRDSVRKVALDKARYRKEKKAEKQKEKQEAKARARALKQAEPPRQQEPDAGSGREAASAEGKRLYVLNFKGDMAARAVACLREEISAVLTMARAGDEVLLRLESPGGMVHAYGLAAAQLARLKAHKIPLTVCVDKVAASGGYMMACLADRLVAAPFAVIGSIGVLFQLPNFHRVLKNHDVDYEVITAGQYKRTLTPFGEITEEARDKVKEEVQEVHALFKNLVKENRPGVDIDSIATGEIWYGTQAKDRHMVDEIRTSDECLMEACESTDVLEVEYEFRRKLPERLGIAAQSIIDRVATAWEERGRSNNFIQ